MMRKFLFKITIIVAFLATSVNVYSQESEVFNWDNVINAIAQVESKGNPKAYNPNGDCCGLLQITKTCVKEANYILKEKGINKKFTLSDRYNAEKSKEMFIILQEHFNKEHNVEKAIKCWNVGFYGGTWKHSSAANKYYNKVKKYL